MKQPLQPGFDHDYATAIIGADTLWGGDVGSESGGDHFIADNFASNLELPAIYHDPLAQYLREQHGASPKTREAVMQFVDKYDLRDLPFQAEEQEKSGDADRKEQVSGLMHSVHLMIETAMARAQGTALPTFRARYESATGTDPYLVPHEPIFEELARSLIIEGKNPRTKQDVISMAYQWEKEQHIPAPEFKTRTLESLKKLLEQTRVNILRKINFDIPGLDPHLDDIAFDGLMVNTLQNVDFTGSSIYLGGEMPDGTPRLQANFEYNIDHPVIPLGLDHLSAHEGIPGHYLNMAIIDLMRLGGKIGIEGAIGTMCTGSTVFQEGWAQATAELLYGNRQAAHAALGNEWRIHTAMERLQDMAKNNAAVLHQERKVPLPQLRSILAESYGLTPAIVKKMSGGWAQHPIMGPMYGPAYWVGGEKVRRAIEQVGAQRVAEVGLHTEGLVDMATFEKKVYRPKTASLQGNSPQNAPVAIAQ